jgi:uncharacterized protein YcfJ
MTRCLLALVVLLLLASPAPASARERRVENVTWAYAQVLRASPVYRMVQVPTSEQRCEPLPGAQAPPRKGGPTAGACRTVQVVYSERRLVGYDVEYAYKGEKYMSRLAVDPGSRLRIRVSVAPDDPAVDHR